ncbi:hypothetical protein ACFQ3H_10555 [Paralysiella testudinis]|uniref:hypothetical protein n=1 Tax=Paralysiella testudinis TaxID=2809020 RepID=UPI003627BB73
MDLQKPDWQTIVRYSHQHRLQAGGVFLLPENINFAPPKRNQPPALMQAAGGILFSLFAFVFLACGGASHSFICSAL